MLIKSNHLQGLWQVPVIKGDCWDNFICQQLVWQKIRSKMVQIKSILMNIF